MRIRVAGTTGSGRGQIALRRPWVIAPMLGLAASLLGTSALAQRVGPSVFFDQLPQRPAVAPVDPKGEFLLEADEVIYDRDNDIVTARGSVEISQGDRVVKADVLSYNRKRKLVTASGNVVMLEPTGDTFFSDYLQISDDLSNAIMENFKALLIDNSRIVAKGMERLAGNRKVMTRAVFSPCNLCKDDPSKPPLWQLKGRQVVHDEEKRDLHYRDATLEVAGVPVFYAPYFSHPDPTVRNRSGFLTPTVGYSNKLGAVFGLPYYGIINDSSDVTVEPRIYSKEALLGAAEYRQRFDHGKIRVAGSFLNDTVFDEKPTPPGLDWRGNFASEGRFDLGEHWRAGWDVARATDRTYLRRYKIGPDFTSKGRYQVSNALTSAAFTEGFYGRSYFGLSSYAFQTLRAEDNRDTIAKIHPAAVASLVSDADSLGGRWKLDADILSYSRKLGTDSTRLATTTGYHLPLITDGGHVFAFSATVQADAYSVNNLPQANGRSFSGEETRLHPQLAATWAYPLINRQPGATFLIEPKVGVVAGPTGSNKSKIPNEDSRVVELDDVNLFMPRRFPGRDRIDSGSRVDYGLRAEVKTDGGASASAMIGQSYRLSEGNNPYPKGSGLEERQSDVVGALKVSPGSWIDFNYRFRLDKDSGTPQREEMGATIYRGFNSLSLSYVNYDRLFPGIGIDSPRSAVASGQVQISEFYRAYAMVSYDLKKDKLSSAGLGILYEDECFAILGSYVRDKLSDQDLRNDQTFFVRVAFKYLGEFGQ